MGEPLTERGRPEPDRGTGHRASPEPRISLHTLADEIFWTDSRAAREARDHPISGVGRLDELAGWLAAAQGEWPARVPHRVRLLSARDVPDRVRSVAESLGIGIRSLNHELPPDAAAAGPEEASRAAVRAAFAAGVAAADVEVDEGTDLLVVADDDTGPAAAVLVGVLSGTEPVAMLPRGAEAVDTAAWIARAVHLRDARRRVHGLRLEPDDLLTAAGGTSVAATAGVIVRAVSRRTPVLLDGTAAVAAAVVCYAAQGRAGPWWQIADSSPDPVHIRAVEYLDARPILSVGTRRGEGTGGLLAARLVCAAAELARPASEPGESE